MRDVQALLRRHGFHFSKSMGQNFLIEDWVPREIAAASGADPSRAVLEIGPGIGALTVELAQRAGKVVSLELDRSLLPILAETLAEFENTEVVPGDITKTDCRAFVAEHLAPLSPIVCANLPYNITTPVLTQLLEAKCFDSITVMIQKEVARRICAEAGSGDYGAFSLLCQYHARCEYLFEVPRECFLPAPKVTSAVVRLTPYDIPPVQARSEAQLFRVIRAAFGQRRKTLTNALSAAFSSLSKAQIAGALESCGLSPAVRGEKLTLEQFAQLSDALEDAN